MIDQPDIDIIEKLEHLQKHGPLSKYFGRQTGLEAIAEIKGLRDSVARLELQLTKRGMTDG